MDVLSTLLSTFIMIFLAELGDKSQLACMSLASTGKHKNVLWGATCAFLVLNTIAVGFGLKLSLWIPEYYLALGMTTLFSMFALAFLYSALRRHKDEDVSELNVPTTFTSIFIFIFVAELGDKTQITTTGLASTYSIFIVWLGASLALFCSTLLAVYVGARWLANIPIKTLHFVCAGIFATFAFMQALSI